MVVFFLYLAVEDVLRCVLLILHVPHQCHPIGVMGSVLIVVIWGHQQLWILRRNMPAIIGGLEEAAKPQVEWINIVFSPSVHTRGLITEKNRAWMSDSTHVTDNTHLRRPVQAGHHSVFSPVLICKLSVQKQLCACLQVTGTKKKKKESIQPYHFFMYSISFSMHLTPPYPQGLCRCSQSRRPPARPELSPQLCCLARKTTRTLQSAGSAASLLLSALWGILYANN